MKILENSLVYVILYVVIAIPTYILPFLGSNSSVVSMTNTALPGVTEVHLGALILLMVIAYFRGVHTDQKWLAVLPFLAAIFDFVPGFSLIPLIPTGLHVFAIIKGASGKIVPKESV